MEEYTISLFGHRVLGDFRKIEATLYTVLCDLMRQKQYVSIYVGRNGEFDFLAASVVKKAQSAIGKEKSSMTLVLPYFQKGIEDYERYYDDVIIPECLEGTYPKGAITKRNQWMIEGSDCLVCYVDHESGGAYHALKYARKLGKTIINLSHIIKNS